NSLSTTARCGSGLVNDSSTSSLSSASCSAISAAVFAGFLVTGVFAFAAEPFLLVDLVVLGFGAEGAGVSSVFGDSVATGSVFGDSVGVGSATGVSAGVGSVPGVSAGGV